MLHYCRLLIVENNSDCRLLLTFIFEQAGAKVVTVSSAQKAFSALDWFKPDILISDLVLPCVDGYTLLRIVRQNQQWKHIPAIAVTALVGESFRQEAFAVGYRAYFTKPFDPDVLVTATSRVGREFGYL